MTSEKSAIAKRLREARGPRSTRAMAEKMSLTRRRFQQMEQGQIPTAWLYLARLAKDGVDVEYLLNGSNGK